jgi:7-carboxy-7-deazaguanine synthase
MTQRLLINELFHSIQGESTWAGLPCIFIRLRGCHLRCTYCDTSYAFTQGDASCVDDVIASIAKWPTKLVEITGGEPLLQADVHPLMQRLADLGYTVLLETSGACDISTCDDRVIRIVDFKTPGSGEEGRNDWANITHLRKTDEVKFVICDRADYDWSCGIVNTHDLDNRVNAVLFSPVVAQAGNEHIAGMQGVDPKMLAQWMLADGVGARLQLQLHKFIWDPSTRGV